MRVQFRNPFPLLIKFKTLINLNSSPKSHRFFPHLQFLSSSSSSGPVNCCNSILNTQIVSTTPMSTANPKPPSLLPSSSVSPIDDVVGIARKCLVKYRTEYTLFLYTPFVLALAAGNLDRDTFRHYIAQDVYFLKAYVEAFNLAEQCSDDDDAKVGIDELRTNAARELKTRDTFAQEWGIDLAKETTPNPATVKYTEFLLATASGRIEGLKASGKLTTPFEKTKVPAYALGAMTPSMRVNAFLGKELLALLGDNGSSHVYKKWIDNYSEEASALETEELLDKLSVTLTGEELEVIEKLYYQAMKLELELFMSQPLVQKIVTPLSTELKETGVHLVLFSDYDLTCTVLDSSAILAEIAIITALKSDQFQSLSQYQSQCQSQSESESESESQSESQSQSQSQSQPEAQIARTSSADLRNTWEILSKQYTEEYEQCIENTLLTAKADKFDYESLHKALEQVSQFEKDANMKVIESRVLKGLDIEDIKKAGQHVVLQDGCTNFFQSILKTEKLSLDIHILSYCWCADLIRSSLSSGGMDVLNIHANEFLYEDGLTTGEIGRKVESPIDKVEAFSKILQDSRKDGKKLTVYIGDSLGDLLCLVQADIGIVIGWSASLRRVGEHFGVSFVPLFPGLVEKQKESSPWKGLSGILYTVSSWAEIHAFILGSSLR